MSKEIYLLDLNNGRQVITYVGNEDETSIETMYPAVLVMSEEGVACYKYNIFADGDTLHFYKDSIVSTATPNQNIAELYERFVRKLQEYEAGLVKEDEFTEETDKENSDSVITDQETEAMQKQIENFLNSIADDTEENEEQEETSIAHIGQGNKTYH